MPNVPGSYPPADLPSTTGDNLKAVHARIIRACQHAGRDPNEVALIAVSKTFPAGDILAAYAAGQRAFGESYVDEAMAKITALARESLAQPIEWHFIGPLQSNKTRVIAENFQWVHGIGRLKIAQRLSDQRPPALGPLNVCIQVNISGEASKSGVRPGELLPLARQISTLPNLRLRGLMAIPEPTSDPALQRVPFARLRHLKDSLEKEGLNLDTLSMGMSDDLEAAIAEGATLVRVGRAIFGERH
ncbi:MAG: YggS family pyridoxal phosphate-dependent enzyme [Betaproteobacteria bacterium]|nr:YggS family pyridoxal phosphate-dependent enzyme [Betaproteobacteria bacterium]